MIQYPDLPANFEGIALLKKTESADLMNTRSKHLLAIPLKKVIRFPDRP
jgi:hypothetical protein